MKEAPEVVISGVSGFFSTCENLSELEQRLFEGLNLIKSDDQIKGVEPLITISPSAREHFDYSFFGIPYKVSEIIDPVIRNPLRLAVEAIADAGVNPNSLSGTDTAVYTTGIYSIMDAMLFSQRSVVATMARGMQANRLSYHLNLRGPSYATYAYGGQFAEMITKAAEVIRRGDAPAAIVCGVSFATSGGLTEQYKLLGRLNHDDKTCPFDDEACGYNRSDGGVAFFLQREEDALRSYGRVVGGTHECQLSKANYIIDSPKDAWTACLRKFYSEHGLDPEKISYVEADGTASKAFDANELNSLAESLVGGRSKPLLVGSFKSLIGHTEAVAGGMGLLKALIASNRDIIPPNANFTKPNQMVPALLQGKIKVVTEPTQMEGDLIAVNSVDFFANLSHIVVERCSKKQGPVPTSPGVLPLDGLPRLLVLTGRNEEAIEEVLKKVGQMPIDPNFIALSHRLFSKGIKNHMFRAYTILGEGTGDKSCEIYQHFTGSSKVPPLWFVFTGMGSQWAGMGSSLMKHPVFARSIQRSHDTLKPKGVDLIHIITTNDEHIFDNILHSFVGIAAIQIGLVDMLYEIGLVPDGMIGHSVGELGCAYADGCFTAEQMILAAYARGKASLDADLIEGMMAAVGKSYEQIRKDLPEEIEVACHNSFNSCTLSGPTEPMTKYVKKLQDNGVFAKLVNVSNIAYHSRYIKPAAPKLLESLQETIPTPKARSKKWISTSVAESEWDSDLAKYSSAEYHTNNLLSPVLFEESSVHIPKDAVIVEVSPHGLLQAILKKSFPEAHHVPLTNRSKADGFLFFLNALGMIYNRGITFDVEKLYPPVDFPVPRGTPSLSSLITWEPSVVPVYNVDDRDKIILKRGTKPLNLNFLEEWAEFNKYKLKGIPIVPLSVYMKLAIDELKEMVAEQIAERSETAHETAPVRYVQVNKLKLHKFVNIDKEEMELTMSLANGFEVSQDGEVVTSAEVSVADPPRQDPPQLPSIQGRSFPGELLYDQLALLGFHVHPSARLVNSLTRGSKGACGSVLWNGDWYAFLEAVLMVPVFAINDKSDVRAVTRIRSMNIDLEALSSSGKREIPVVYEFSTNSVRTEGLEIYCENIVSVFKNTKSKLFMQAEFLPYNKTDIKTLDDLLVHSRDIIMSNNSLDYGTDAELTLIELYIKDHKSILAAFESVPGLKINAKCYQEDIFKYETLAKQVVDENYLIVCDDEQFEKFSHYMKFSNQGYFLLKNVKTIPEKLLVIISRRIGNDTYALCKCGTTYKSSTPVVNLNNTTQWESLLQNEANRSGSEPVYLLSSFNNMSPGQMCYIIEKCRKFKNSRNIRYIFTDQTDKFNLAVHKDQLNKNLRLNIYQNGQWGCMSYYDRMTREEIQSELVHIPIYQFSQLRAKDIDIEAIGITHNECSENTQKLKIVEYCGKKNGREVCGIGTLNEITKMITPDEILQWDKPKDWSSGQITAAILPYLMAYYISDNSEPYYSKGARTEQKVLVLQGANCICQALINVLLKIYDVGDVYTTYETEKEFNLIRKLFPKIPVKNLINSGHNNFTEKMLVDFIGNKEIKFSLIVNPTSDKSIVNKCIPLLDLGGVFCQTSPVENDGKIGMFTFLYEITALSVTYSSLMEMATLRKVELKEMFSQALSHGEVKPIEVNDVSMDTTNLDALQILKNPTKRLVLSKCGQKYEESLWYSAEPNSTYFLIVNENDHRWLDVLEWLLKRNISQLTIVDTNGIVRGKQYILNDIKRKQPDLMLTVETQSSSGRLRNCLKEAKLQRTVPLVFIVGKEEATRLDVICQELQDSNILYLTSSFDPSFECSVNRGSQIIDKHYLLEQEALAHSLDRLTKTLNGVFYVSDETLKATIVIDDNLVRLREHLPASVKDVTVLGKQSPRSVGWKEVRTATPLAKDIPGTTPVFMIPPIRDGSYDKLLEKLMYPTFKAVIPKDMALDQIANHLFQEFLKFNTNVLNMICCDWSLNIGISIAKLAEASGKDVNLILLDYSFSWQSQEVASFLKNKAFSEMDERPISRNIEKYIQSGFEMLDDRVKLALSEPIKETTKISSTILLICDPQSSSRLLCRIQEHSDVPVVYEVTSASSFTEMLNCHRTAELINAFVWQESKDFYNFRKKRSFEEITMMTILGN